MRAVLLATSAIIVTSSVPAAAQTVISTKRTTPVSTSTVNAGNPDAISISSTGSVEVLSGAAVTVDSNHGVTNAGKIVVSNAANGTGILVNAGTSGDIVNSGEITVDESYTATDIDNDGDLDGPFATGSGRAAIRTLGAHTGKITHTGTITVEGNDSAGIVLGGPLTGAFTHDGKTTVIGTNAIGVKADAITGNVRLAGTITVTGQNAVGAKFSGDVTGAMVIQGSITSSGYRYTSPPADVSKLDADDLLQGGSAVVIEGNVTGGVILAIPPKDNSASDPDEDHDGIEDAKEGSALIRSYGAAPAMVVGATDHAITLGAISGLGTGFGLQNDGSILGDGLYSGVAATGLQIGGRGGAVTITGGMGNAGTIAARSVGSNATALLIGNGASLAEVRNSGILSASGGASTGNQSTALQIDAGANVSTLRNSGSIKATAGGTGASATAIWDKAGTVNLLENSGSIGASGAAADSGRNIAINFSANTTGVTIRQTVVASGIAAPSITGDIITGSGADLIDLADGTLAGTVNLGGGNDRLALSGDAEQTGKVLFGAGDDTMTMAGTSSFTGTLDFAGGGADNLTLSGTARFAGTLANSSNLALSVNSGRIELTAPTSLASFSLGTGGTLVATLDKRAGQGTSLNVSGAASFASGSVIQLKLADVATAEGRYTVLTAGSLSGTPNLAANTDLIPFMYKAAIATGTPANQLAIDIVRRSVSELGLNASQGSAYDAIYAALATDADVAGVFLNITKAADFRSTINQLLPDHAGGMFRAISLGSRTMARQLRDPAGKIVLDGKIRLGFDMGTWGATKAEDAISAYDAAGIGAGARAELETGFGVVGLGINWLWNQNKSGVGENKIESTTFELGAYWRGDWNGLSAFLRGSIGTVGFQNFREFNGKSVSKTVTRVAAADWRGWLTTASAGLSYELDSGAFFVRPFVSGDYVRLSENAYTEVGGGAGVNLSVDKRISSEAFFEGGLAAGIDFLGSQPGDANWLRVEAEGGWGGHAGGKLGATTARFGSAAPFTLQAEQAHSGWFARLRALGGGDLLQMGGEFTAENRGSRTSFGLRGTVRLAL